MAIQSARRNHSRSRWCRRYGTEEPAPAIPILSLHLRPALLAGVAVVERAGPEMLEMLRGQMMGVNKVPFSSATDEIMNHTRRSVASSQLQLI